MRKFLLTHPVWDVTADGDTFDLYRIFLLTHPVWDVTAVVCGFLLTHPVWDVTALSLTMGFISINFYSHIPCGM